MVRRLVASEAHTVSPLVESASFGMGTNHTIWAFRCNEGRTLSYWLVAIQCSLRSSGSKSSGYICSCDARIPAYTHKPVDSRSFPENSPLNSRCCTWVHSKPE
uniref:(northern house mosquito) hypothetical protein n=1 Tax=Culex pipiens TaxID=7175 RepID=A0A8D8D2W3_CULPI